MSKSPKCFEISRHIDLCLAQTLVAPLFNCLDNLIDEQPDDEDIKCAAQIIIAYGNLLNEQSISETTQLVMKSRQLLCSTAIPRSEETNTLLIAVSDLWGAGWKKARLPEVLHNFHDERNTFINYFSQYSRQKSSGSSHRSRSSSGYGSPARSGCLTVIPSKKLTHDPLFELAESQTSELSEPQNRDPETFV